METKRMYTQENATTVRTARDIYDAKRQSKNDAKQSAFEKMAKRTIQKFSRRMKRTGRYYLSMSAIKKINGGSKPYFATVSYPDTDWAERNRLQDQIEAGYSYASGKFGDFQQIAADAGIKFSYCWEEDKTKKRFVVKGFNLYFKR